MIGTLHAEELGPLGTRLLQVLDLAEPAIGERLLFDQALTLESLAHSALRERGEFIRWRTAQRRCRSPGAGSIPRPRRSTPDERA